MAAMQTVIPVEEELQNPAQIDVYEEGQRLKEEADALFRQDKVKDALSKYYHVLLRWKGLVRQGSTPGIPSPKVPPASSDDKRPSQLNIDLEKLHSNMSACNMRLGRWKRTIETADEALKLNKDNTKALFRKAKAYGELGYFEKAEPIFTDLIQKTPSEEKNLRTELEHLRQKDKDARKKTDIKLKGFLKSTSKTGIFDASSKPVITYEEDEKDDDSPSAKITEVDEEKEKEAQKKADQKMRGFLNKTKKNGIFKHDVAKKPAEQQENEIPSAKIEEVTS